MSSHANISDTPLDQRSPRPPKEGVLNSHGHTDRQTDGHGDSMTELAQWGDSVEMKKKRYYMSKNMWTKKSACKLKLFRNIAFKKI